MRQALLLAMLAGMLAGCTSSTGASPQLHHSRSVLEWGLVGIGDVPTLDPVLASDPTSITVTSLIYGGLVRLDSHLRVQPDGCSHWTVSRDGLTYTFSLRPNLRFADGRPVTAADFAASLQRALAQPASAGAGGYLSLISDRTLATRGKPPITHGISILNSSTLEIILKRPAAHFLAELAFPTSYVVDSKLLSRYGSSWADHAAGFGSYRVTAWRHSKSLVLTPNPYYYGGKPGFRRITLHFYQQSQTAIDAYSSGRLDIVSGFQPGDQVGSNVTGIHKIGGLALDYLAFNTSRKPFQALDARRAFAALDLPHLASKSMDGSAVPARTFLPSAFGIPTSPWLSLNTPQTYIARAGYPKSRGLPQPILILPRDPQISGLASALSKAWDKSLGVTVETRQLNSSNYATVLSAHAFDMAIVRWGADYPDPQAFLGTQLGSAPTNVTGWSTRSYTSLLALADSYNPADARRESLFRQAAQQASDQLPLVPLDEPALTAIIRPDLRGLGLTALGTINGDWPRAHFRS